jgi:hypothetical protein
MTKIVNMVVLMHQTCNIKYFHLPNRKVDGSEFAHLNEQQRQEFVAVLDKYPEVFK